MGGAGGGGKLVGEFGKGWQAAQGMVRPWSRGNRGTGPGMGKFPKMQSHTPSPTAKYTHTIPCPRVEVPTKP